MFPTFDAFLFDMDGTILTSIPAVERAWTAWALRAGAPVDEVLHYLHGRMAIDTISRFAPAGADIAAEVAWLDARELEDLDGISAIAGAGKMLASLPKDRWAVVTSANRQLAERRIAAAGLPQPPLLISSNDVQRGKPDPEGYLQAASLMRVRAKRCLVFEDTTAGLQAGLAAGAQVVRVLGTSGADQPKAMAAIANYVGLAVTMTDQGLALNLADLSTNEELRHA